MIIKKNEIKVVKSHDINKTDEIKEDKEFKQYIYKGKKIIKILQDSLKEFSNGGFMINTSVFVNTSKLKNISRSNDIKINPLKLTKSPARISHKYLFESLFKTKFNKMKHHQSNSTIPIANDNKRSKVEKKKNRSSISNVSDINIDIDSSKNHIQSRLKAYNSKPSIKNSNKKKIHLITSISPISYMIKQRTYQSTQSIFQRTSYNSIISETRPADYSKKRNLLKYTDCI